MSKARKSKVDIVLATLATGIYRPWYWAGYKDLSKQSKLREEWSLVVGRFTASEIREGLARWSSAFGADTPPTPEAFASFLRPVHTSGSRTFFAEMKHLRG